MHLMAVVSLVIYWTGKGYFTVDTIVGDISSEGALAQMATTQDLRVRAGRGQGGRIIPNIHITRRPGAFKYPFLDTIHI